MNEEERKQYMRDYMPAYHAANREKRKAQMKAWYWEHREEQRAKAKEYHKAHKRAAAAQKRFAKYGVSAGIYEATLDAQGGECAICQLPMDKPVVDHCHVSGLPRALLCSKCNTGIGLLGEDCGTLRAAIGYLECWEEMLAAKQGRMG